MNRRIRIYKETNPALRNAYKMWRGSCTCGKDWNFWFWGASLGFGLEHLWKEHQHEHA